MEIRRAVDADRAGIWSIFQRVVATGDSYVFPTDSDQTIFDKHWMHYNPFIAIEDGNVVGTYILKANQIGLGSHIANGSYMVHPDHHGKGIGKQLGIHSLDYAREQGFKAIQFNIVIATNKPAVALWEKLGFRIIGTAPRVFNHRTLGLVDAHIMFREL